jgi:2-keto-3-deoxy-6-phosphogluconate aldolase
MLKLFPTAGITPENFMEVLERGAFGCGFVASLFPPGALRERDFATVETIARRIHAELERKTAG